MLTANSRYQASRKEIMPSTEYDMRFFQAGIEELEQYLLSKDIYWPIGISALVGEPTYPQLTLGALLLVQERLEATAGTAQQQAEFQKLQDQLNAIRSHWRAAWGKKAQVEFRARLNLWRDFLSDYRNDPGAHYDRFGYEAGRRVMLQLLYPEADELPQAHIELLAALDAQLKALLQPGAFVWELKLAKSFPPDTYWYLYGSLPQN
jgi:hypothetical protein